MDMAGYLFVHFTGEDKDGEQIYFSLSRDGLHWEDLYCRLPGFTVVPPGKYLAGGLQSGCTANLTGAQYKWGKADSVFRDGNPWCPGSFSGSGSGERENLPDCHGHAH